MRIAKCNCGKTKPSSKELPFFQDKSDKSEIAKKTCNNCGYYYSAHLYDQGRVVKTSVIDDGKCQGFESKGEFEYDSFYCGCFGWD